MNPLAHSLSRSPELFPIALDPRSEAVALIGLSRSDYDQASFLDERVMSAARSRRTLPCSELEDAVGAAGLTERSDFIFHIGHVGSTLLSRLIGAHPGAFGVREPGALRTLAQIHSGSNAPASPWNAQKFDRRLSAFLKLYSRTFDANTRAVVKATSFVSDLAPGILSRDRRARALLMFVRAETYLATILGGENAPAEARMLAPMRRLRLEKRLGASIESPTPLSPGELIALGWLAEMLAIAAARDAAHEQTLPVDFDAFLARPEASLSACFRHFDLATTDQTVAEIVSGPLMRRYAKAPEHAYDPALRSAVLAQARASWGAEIRRGLDWLDARARDHRLAENAFALSGG